MRFITLALFCTSTLGAVEATKVERFNYNHHSYLVFNNNHYLHDPDCKCNLRYEGWVRMGEDNLRFHLIKKISEQD